MQLMNVKEVAAMLHLGIRTVWAWRDRGLLPAPRKISGAVRWVKPEIEAWIEGGCKPCRPANTRRIG